MTTRIDKSVAPLSVAAIRTEMRAKGSHWWDAETMRGCRAKAYPDSWLCPDGRTMFVARSLNFDTSYRYTLHFYTPGSGRLETHSGQPAGADDLIYDTQAEAQQQAELLCLPDVLPGRCGAVAVSTVVEDLGRDLAEATGRPHGMQAARRLMRAASRWRTIWETAVSHPVPPATMAGERMRLRNVCASLGLDVYCTDGGVVRVRREGDPPNDDRLAIVVPTI